MHYTSHNPEVPPSRRALPLFSQSLASTISKLSTRVGSEIWGGGKRDRKGRERRRRRGENKGKEGRGGQGKGREGGGKREIF